METENTKRVVASAKITLKNLTEEIDWYQKSRDFYKRLALKVELIIKDILEHADLSYHNVTSRAKDMESFVEKASKEKYNDPKNQIMDLAGIRVTAYVESDVKKICDLIEKEFKIYEEHSGDKSENLGENIVGYRSVHYVAEIDEKRGGLPEYNRFRKTPFEIQVRTILQHAWAEIEHDRNYKLKGELPEKKDIKRRFSLLAAALESADREFDSIVRDIDSYTEDVKEDTRKGHLDIPIDSISLKEYLDNKLKDIEIRRSLGNSSVIIHEMKKFGINNLSVLDELISDKFIKQIEEMGTSFTNNYVSLLRILMIQLDKEKYFTKAKHKDFNHVGRPFLNILKGFGIERDEVKNYGMKIIAQKKISENE